MLPWYVIHKVKGLFTRRHALVGIDRILARVTGVGLGDIKIGENKAKCEKGVLRCVFDVRRLMYRAIKMLLGKCFVVQVLRDFQGVFVRSQKTSCQLITWLICVYLYYLARFAGKKDRPWAAQELNTKSDGTFLIRESVNRSGEYALSVK